MEPRFKDLILPKELVLLPDSVKTGKLQHVYKSMPYTYTDANGEEKQGTYSITFLGNNKYDSEVLPKGLPQHVEACLWNSFFGQYNKIYNEEIPLDLRKLKWSETPSSKCAWGWFHFLFFYCGWVQVPPLHLL